MTLKGSVMQKKPCSCVGCRKPLWRTTHFKTAKCEKCNRRTTREKQHISMKVLRKHARRYRLILHFLGWEDEQFEEMLIEMKRSPMAFRKRAEGGPARFDLAVEQHPEKFKGAKNPHRRYADRQIA